MCISGGLQTRIRATWDSLQFALHSPAWQVCSYGQLLHPTCAVGATLMSQRTLNVAVQLSGTCGLSAGPVLRHNDTDDARAKVLNCEELMHHLHQRAQAAVNSRVDAEEHQRHVS